MQLTRNFNLKEFHSKDGVDVPYNLLINAYQLACELQVIRDEIDQKLFINSAYRTPDHNKNVGGAKGSYHLKCLGGDLKAQTLSPSQLFKVILDLYKQNKIRKKELLLYNTHVHYAIQHYLL